MIQHHTILEHQAQARNPASTDLLCCVWRRPAQRSGQGGGRGGTHVPVARARRRMQHLLQQLLRLGGRQRLWQAQPDTRGGRN